MVLAQLLDRPSHAGAGDFVNFKSASNPFQEGDRQVAAEVLAKLIQPDEQSIDVKHFDREGGKAKLVHERENPLGIGIVEVSRLARVDDVQCDSNRDGFAMPDPERGELLELV